MKRVRAIAFLVGMGLAWYDVIFLPGRTTWFLDLGYVLMGVAMAQMIGALETELRKTKQALEQAQYKAEFWKTMAKEES